MFQFHMSFNGNLACDLNVTMLDLPLARKCLNEWVYLSEVYGYNGMTSAAMLMHICLCCYPVKNNMEG